jgi:NB-ARC domain
MNPIPRGAAFATVAAVLACVVPAVLLVFSWHNAQFGGDLAATGAVVAAVGAAVTAWLAVQDRREAHDRGQATRTEIATGLPDSNPVAAQATRVLAAVEDICGGRRAELDEYEGQGRFIRRAIDQAIEALGPAQSGTFRERLNSLGLDPSMMIGPLDGDERTASAWAAADPHGELARTREQFRQRLLEILASDETSWLLPNTRRFFGEALEGGRRFSRQWAGILPVVNARLVKTEPGTEAAQARARCRIPADKEIIGRSDQLAEIAARITELMANSGSAVALITGEQPGVGASAVAKELARRLGRPPLFPGGVLYFNLQLREANFQILDNDLRALEKIQRMTAEDVAREVLSALDATPGTLPFAAYRAAMEANGVLLVLDDADDASHVAPLAVQIPNCCVLVTSRRHNQTYADFSATVGKLDPEDGIDLLLTYAGTRPVFGWPSSIREPCRELAAYCENLPMALHLVGGQLSTSHLEMSLEERLEWLKDRLRAERGRLPRVEGEDQAISKAVTLSYALLDDFGRRLLRMCHAINEYTVTCWEAASCLGQTEEWPCFEDALENFVDMSLARTTREPSRRRPLITYSLYNFIRWFAAYLRHEDDLDEPMTQFTRRFVIYMQRCLAALSEGGAEADHVDSGVAHFPELLITAVQLAYANQWDDLGIPLATALIDYLTSAGLDVKTAVVEGQLADFYQRGDQPRPAALLLLRASGRLRRAGMPPESRDDLLTAAMESGQRALDLAWRYELGEYVPHAAFAVSLAAAELHEWERALAAGSTAATWLREPDSEEADVQPDAVFHAVINLGRIARNAGLLGRARNWAQEAAQLDGPARLMALAQAELAQVLTLQKNRPDALNAYENAISLFEEARDFANAAEAAGSAALICHGEEAIRQHYRSIELWERAELVDVRPLSIERINLGAALFTEDAPSGTADILVTAIKELTAFGDAPLLLLEAQVRRAGLSLFLDGQPHVPSVDASDEVARQAHVKDEIDALRHGDHGLPLMRARETLLPLLISPARNDVQAENWYFQQLGDEPY